MYIWLHPTPPHYTPSPPTGDPGSRVWGSVREGVFEGVVHSDRDGTYYVERAHKYFPGHNATLKGFHSVIYHDRHVGDPYQRLRHGHTSGCGATDDVAAWMDAVQNSVDPVEERREEERKEREARWSSTSNQYKYKKWLEEHEEYRMIQEQEEEEDLDEPGMYDIPLEDYHHHDQGPGKYSEEANMGRPHHRRKRAIGIGVGADNKGTCSLSIQTDPMLWHHIFNQVLITTTHLAKLSQPNPTISSVLTLVCLFSSMMFWSHTLSL